MRKNLKYFLNVLSEKLWIKPLIFCLLSIAGAFAAHLADNSFIDDIAPDIEKSSLKDLLSTLSATMLVISIFAVGSMISAFSAASATATPRSFKLIVADDISQNALSVYMGSFIFSIVASIAFENGYYGKAGFFTLFIITLTVFVIVILTFLRWVERISRLGRLGHTITKVERAASAAIHERIKLPYMGGKPVVKREEKGVPVTGNQIGYIQHINMEKLQQYAEEFNIQISINSVPGSFVTPDKPLAYIFSAKNSIDIDIEKFIKPFVIDINRSFHDDPRFGLIVLSEIGSRALSPGINDPGTAIDILGSYVRLFSIWIEGLKNIPPENIIYNRIEIPELSVEEMFNDAFRPISRDGAGNVEVMIRLQKALKSLSYVGNKTVKKLTLVHSRQAYERAKLAIQYKGDLTILESECLFNIPTYETN